MYDTLLQSYTGRPVAQIVLQEDTAKNYQSMLLSSLLNGTNTDDQQDISAMDKWLQKANLILLLPSGIVVVEEPKI